MSNGSSRNNPKGQAMKFLTTSIVALCILAQGAHASSHSSIARELTLARLQNEVTAQCGSWSLPFTKCNELRSLVSDLYRNPTVATKADLAILNRMEELGKEVSGAKTDLALAIGDASQVFAHVVNDHGGKWEDHICGSPSA